MDGSVCPFEGQGPAGEQAEYQTDAKGFQDGNRAPGKGRLLGMKRNKFSTVFTPK